METELSLKRLSNDWPLLSAKYIISGHFSVVTGSLPFCILLWKDTISLGVAYIKHPHFPHLFAFALHYFVSVRV